MSEVEETNGRERTLSGSSDKSEDDIEVHFQPLIKLPEVTIPTNEENEIVLLKMRAKLYRFDTSTEDGPEWKERGTGEVKLLRHKEQDRVRVVMRRDKTLKVCANHFITPWMELKPSTGSDKAFVYKVPADFADEEAKSECLAIKFGNIDSANMFKEKFNEAKDIILTSKSHITKENGKEPSSKSNSEEKQKDVTKEVTEQLSDLNVSKEEK